MSKELKRHGFTFVGTTICYAFISWPLHTKKGNDDPRTDLHMRLMLAGNIAFHPEIFYCTRVECYPRSNTMQEEDLV
jgi:hypothetical protein